MQNRRTEALIAAECMAEPVENRRKLPLADPSIFSSQVQQIGSK
jgi:hypothetical protein